MSSSSDPLANERIQSLNRLACKLLLHTKEMVDYVEGVGLREGHNLEFLERVTRATKMTLGKLAKQNEGDEEEEVLWGACRVHKRDYMRANLRASHR